MQICPNINCPHPNLWYSTQDNFCTSCGTRLIPAKRCKKCSTELMPSADYCPDCGLSTGGQA